MNDLQAMEELWYLQQRQQEWSTGRLFQRAQLPRATPQVMDALWADGWRHFGPEFFRDKYSLDGSRLQKIIPLRVALARFSPRRDQRRTLKRSESLEITVQPTQLTDEYRSLFARHSARFSENIPPSLEHFLGSKAEPSPCAQMSCEVRRDGQLLAVSFIDLGSEALSSVYAIFEPEERRLSLGNMTLLMELRFARMLGKRYLYTGYGHTVPSSYEYKKRFQGTEYYNWAGRWLPIEELDLDELPVHPYEREDIPPELLGDDSSDDSSDGSSDDSMNP